MLTNILLVICVLLAVLLVVMVWKLLQRRSDTSTGVDLAPRFDELAKGLDRSEKTLKDELSRNREEAATSSRQLREEVSKSIGGLVESVLAQIRAFGEFQTKQLEIFANQLKETGQLTAEKLDSARTANAEQLKNFGETLNGFQKQQHDALAAHIKNLTDANEKRLESLRVTLDQRLQQIQEDNSKKLEAMRATVDEKLQGTLEKRLGESFKLVSERLELVHKGLGEMQSLANGVGDLKRVLTNVKTRGNWGEIQLGTLLEQMLTPDQYEQNVATGDTSERVEYAIKLPGKHEHPGDFVWLPIDAKFPTESYQRLVEAQEAADVVATALAMKELEARVKGCAKDICTKYINPPKTTDFGIMFLPTEGLYAEVIRRAGLVESIQREYRIVIAGPTTLAALLNSLQMGFRTLAIEKRSSEVWELLGGVKTEFGKFGDVIGNIQKKLLSASNEFDQVAVRTRAINRKLRGVQQLNDNESLQILGETDGIASAEDTDSDAGGN